MVLIASFQKSISDALIYMYYASRETSASYAQAILCVQHLVAYPDLTLAVVGSSAITHLSRSHGAIVI